MSTANPISGVSPLSSNLMRRPPTSDEGGRLVGEASPSGLAQVEYQTVTPPNSAENASLADNGRNPDKQEVADAVKNMNDFMQMIRRTLQFSLDEDSGQMVVQIKDQETDKVIRQIPSELMLKLADQMDKFKGLLFEEKV